MIVAITAVNERYLALDTPVLGPFEWIAQFLDAGQGTSREEAVECDVAVQEPRKQWTKVQNIWSCTGCRRTC